MWVTNTNIMWGDKKIADMFIVNDLREVDLSEVSNDNCRVIDSLDSKVDDDTTNVFLKLGANRYGKFPTIFAAELFPGNFPKMKKYHFICNKWVARDDKDELKYLWTSALESVENIDDTEAKDMLRNDVIRSFTNRWTKSTTGRTTHMANFLQDCITLYKKYYSEPTLLEHTISPKQFGDYYFGDVCIPVDDFKTENGAVKSEKVLYDFVVTIGYEVYKSANTADSATDDYGSRISVDEFADIIFKNYPEARDILESHGVLNYEDFKNREAALEQMKDLGANKPDEVILNIYRQQLADIGQA